MPSSKFEQPAKNEVSQNSAERQQALEEKFRIFHRKQFALKDVDIPADVEALASLRKQKLVEKREAWGKELQVLLDEFEELIDDGVKLSPKMQDNFEYLSSLEKDGTVSEQYEKETKARKEKKIKEEDEEKRKERLNLAGSFASSSLEPWQTLTDEPEVGMKPLPPLDVPSWQLLQDQDEYDYKDGGALRRSKMSREKRVQEEKHLKELRSGFENPFLHD